MDPRELQQREQAADATFDRAAAVLAAGLAVRAHTPSSPPTWTRPEQPPLRVDKYELARYSNEFIKWEGVLYRPAFW